MSGKILRSENFINDPRRVWTTKIPCQDYDTSILRFETVNHYWNITESCRFPILPAKYVLRCQDGPTVGPTEYREKDVCPQCPDNNNVYYLHVALGILGSVILIAISVAVCKKLNLQIPQNFLSMQPTPLPIAHPYTNGTRPTSGPYTNGTRTTSGP